MKPIYYSKKAQTAFLALLAIIVAHQTGSEDVVEPIMILGAILIASFGAADFGKEAVALEEGDE